MFELNNFNAMQIGIASPEKIREWSHGEVLNPETINYRTQKPVRDGLFCEKIFGPTKDWECHCGKYKRIRYKGIVCDKCGVEVTRSKVRRERMGHVELATPVSHIWFFKGVPSRMSITLDIGTKGLEQVLYYVCSIVLDPKNTDLEYKQILTDKELREAIEKYGEGSFTYGMGGEAIKKLLQDIDVEKETASLKAEAAKAKGQKKIKLVRRIEVMEAFLKSGNKPEWMILDVLPVLPADLRPIVQLEGNKVATSDLNELYRRVINRNNRLKKLLELGAPDVIIRNEKRMLQEAVDSLIDNGKRGKPVMGNNHELKSLAALLKGKSGRFRMNLLGKRVDYSGRSVITVGPELKLYQCGLSKEMALELFKPFVLRKLIELNKSTNIKSAQKLIEKEKPVVWDVLEDVIKDHPVMLNRAPTLHRLGVQAFQPVLIEGRSIQLHPLVCSGFNADFDGDQMSVHIPITLDARAEARMLMLSSNNIIKPSDGKPIAVPQQDMIMGAYWLTIDRDGDKGEGMVFGTENEALNAYSMGYVTLQSKIKLRRKVQFGSEEISGIIDTTVGKIIFNRIIPQNLGFVDRSVRENALKFEIDFPVGKKQMGQIVGKAVRVLGNADMVKMLDDIKSTCFHYSMIASNSLSVFEMHLPEQRNEIIKEAEDKVILADNQFRRGIITAEERRDFIKEAWGVAISKLSGAIIQGWDKFNATRIMADSNARAKPEQLVQLAGIIGQMKSASGETIEVPIKSNYRLGLSTLEYFLKCRGARKGLADTALKTADSGYLTRRLVDVAQNIVITEDDCFAALGEKPKGIKVSEIKNVETLEERIIGRVAAEEVVDANGNVLVEVNELISPAKAKKVAEAGIKEVTIRSVLTCKSKTGICAKCYGKAMTSEKLVNIGEPVGVIAAQSIGEPGTQLTMRTFHSGGIAAAEDITTGLPRVEELFEARKPKGAAIISEVAGKVTVRKVDKLYEVLVKTSDDIVSYLIPFGSKAIVKDGDVVEAGTPLSSGNLNPSEILKTRGIRGVQDYLLREVLNVYKQGGSEVSDKHVEIIIKQMLRNVKIEDAGQTNLLPGDIVDVYEYEEAITKAFEEGKAPATAKRILQGITKASLTTPSFLSAASFQETSAVLSNAAIKGKIDRLQGLKENIIIGKQIPAGTGLKVYENIEPVRVEDEIPQDAFAGEIQNEEKVEE